MVNILQNKFNEEVLEAIEKSKKLGYVPTRFIQMLQQENNCNIKPWLHEEHNCQYRIEHNYKE